MKDKFFLGALAGMAGALVMSFLNFIINLIPGVNMKLLFGVSQLFVPKAMSDTLPGTAIGFIAHLICGALVGIAFLLVFEYFSYDYPLLKGTFLGLASWFIMCGILGRVLRLPMQDKILDNILFILIHIPYGITTAWIINRYYRHPHINKEVGPRG